MDERLTISVPEAAVRLGIGTTKAWELARRGELPGAFRVGRSVRVSVEALRAWVEREATKTAA
jgi:excisionase family DNA binding protein